VLNKQLLSEFILRNGSEWSNPEYIRSDKPAKFLSEATTRLLLLREGSLSSWTYPK